MEKSVVQEYKEYNYLLDDDSWKGKLPSFTLYASEIQTYHPKVSVIIANYNNGPYLERMMDSLMEQTLGIHNLQVMFIDDRSTDNSLDIVKPYTQKYPNVEIYHLDKNTGGAHGPRNVGLLNARGEYLVFLDADDWYAPNGLKALADLLDSSGDGIAFGGIMRSINGVLYRGDPSYIEMNRTNRPINELPYDFYSWLGPQANMVRASIVYDHNLHFIDQRVADDVTFFIQILRFSKTISQTSELTTYLNRDDDNASLSKSVNENFMLSWLRAISYLMNNYEMDTSLERFIARRLEWLVLDFGLRWDTGYGFSKEKVKNFADQIDKYLGPLPFDPGSYFKTDARKITWKALIERDFDFIVKFFEWYSLPFYDKKMVLIDDHYYYVPDDSSLPNVEINTRVEGEDVIVTPENIRILFSIYTNETVDYCELRSLHNPWDNKIIDVVNEGNNLYSVDISRELYQTLDDDAYEVIIRTNSFHDNPILIHSIQRYTAADTVIRNIDNNVALEKRKVNEGHFLVAGRLTDKDMTGDSKVKELGWVTIVGSSFLGDGRFAALTDDDVRISSNPKFYTSISSDMDEDDLLELSEKYYLKTGLYMLTEDIPVLKSFDEEKNKTFDQLLEKGKIITVTDVVHDVDMRFYFQIGHGKYIEADREKLKSLKVDFEKYNIDNGIYQVKKKKLPILEAPEKTASINEYVQFYDLIRPDELTYNEDEEVLYFSLPNGFVSAAKDNFFKAGEEVNDGFYHKGRNFVVGAAELPVYKDEDLTIEAESSPLVEGDMFTVRSFGISDSGEYILNISGKGFVSASKGKSSLLNPEIKPDAYCLKYGKYQILSKEEQGYRSPNFGKRFQSRSYKKGDTVTAVGFGISEKGYPRLKLSDGSYVTSNKKFIKYEGE